MTLGPTHPAHELAVLRNTVRDLEARLAQAEAAVEWGPPNRPSQAALDIAAKREIERLRNAVRAHREAVTSLGTRGHIGSFDRELWRYVEEGDRS